MAQGTPTAPAILYPTGAPTFNTIDTVLVEYITPWTAGANMTVNCHDTPTASHYWLLWAYNPLHESGTYQWVWVGVSLSQDIAQYPTTCWFFLYPNLASQGQGITGGNFTMISTGGVAKTWAAATSFTPYTSTGVTSTATASTTTASTTTTLSPSTSSTTPTAAGAQTSTATPTATPSSGLSTGAKIGIGVSSGIGGLFFLLLVVLCIFWLHKRFSRTSASPSPGMVVRSPERMGGELDGRANIYEKSAEPTRMLT